MKSSRRRSTKQTERRVTFEETNDTICNVCHAEFIDPMELQRHVNQVHLTKFNRQRFCKFCSMLFPSIVDYTKHIRDAHIHCLKICQCSRVFEKENDLNHHEKKHQNKSNQNMYCCSQCPMLFTRTIDLKNHEFKQHEETGDGFFLQPCYPYLSSLLKVKIETFLQTMKNGKRFVCARCGFATSELQEFIKHSKKTTCQVYVCDVCCNIYTKLSGLVRHTKKFKDNEAEHKEYYTETEKSKVRCRFCRNFCNSENIKEHMSKCNTAFECKHCELTFKSVSLLTSHQVKDHPVSASLFSCKYCRQELVGEDSLKKHINKLHKHEIHLYKYPCVHCGEIFKHPNKLFGHFHYRHSNIKPFHCKICNKNFFVRKTFTIHIKMQHKSDGIVKFDDNFNVYFTKKDIENRKNNCLAEHDYTKIDDNEELTNSVTNTNDTDLSIIDEEEKEINTGVTQKKPEESHTQPEVSEGVDDSQTENENKHLAERIMKTKKLKMKRSRPKTDSDSSDDEPLSTVAKKRKTYRNLRSNGKQKFGQKRFTCTICKKYCFSFNNYNRHFSSHFRRESKQCIKCAKRFETQEMLKEHLAKEHSTSKLTDTLKMLLARRKQGIKSYTQPMTNSEKIRRTVKKFNCDHNAAKATVKFVTADMSVRKFLEDFVPEEGTEKTEEKKEVQVRLLVNQPAKKPSIKMIKANLKPLPVTKKLAMPVKFSKQLNQKHQVEIKLINNGYKSRPKLNFGKREPQEETFSIEDMPITFETEDGEEEINTVEITQEESEETVEENTEVKNINIEDFKAMLPKVMPNLPPEMAKDIRIATLLPVAPYYKILKYEDLTKTTEEVGKPIKSNLVNVNPLAHLMGNKVLELPKYYKPKIKNYEGAIANALINLDKPVIRKKKNNEI